MKAKLLASIFILAAHPAMAAGLSIDSASGYQSGQAKGTASISSNPLTTKTPGDIIVACVHAEWLPSAGASGTILKVTDTAGLTWSRRGAPLSMHGGSANAYNDLEMWWAYSPNTLNSEVITATYNLPSATNFDGASMIPFGVSGFTGTAYQTNPWDPDGALPVSAMSTAAGNPTVPGLFTSNPNGMALGCEGAAAYIASYAAPGFTIINSTDTAGVSNFSTTGVEQMSAAAAQSNLSVGFQAPSPGWLMIADALSQAGGTGGGGGGGNPSPGLVNLQTGVTGILPVANGGTGTATPSLTAGPNITITGTWPNLTISSTGGTPGPKGDPGVPGANGVCTGTCTGGGGGGPLSMTIVSPPALNVINANQMQAAALDYMAITDAAAQVTAGPIPITVKAPGLADVQVWTHGALNIHLTGDGAGNFTGTLDLSHEPNGPILVGYYGFDQVAPLIPNTELVGKYILFVTGGSNAAPPLPKGAAGLTLAFDEEWTALNVSPCVPGSYPCVPSSENATWYPNKGDGGDFGDAWFGHPGEADNPFTVKNGFMRIRMTHCQPADNCVDPYHFGRTWKSGLLATAYPDGTTTFDGIRHPVMADGYYEAKILWPDGGGPDDAGTNGSAISGGTWGAWWMLTINAAKCAVKTGACDPALVNGNDEFDIDEQYGKFAWWDTTGSHVYGANIGTSAYAYHSQPSADVPVLLPVKSFTWDFHRYGVLIKNGVAQLYVDDVALGNPTVLGVFPGSPTPVINWFVLLNLALGGGWPEAAPPAQYYDQWHGPVRYFH
jgi:hypothetical protein